MSRSFSYVVLIMAGMLAVTLLSGSLVGTLHALSASASGGQNMLSPMAVGYGVLGLMMGMMLASLIRFSWHEVPKIVMGFFRGKRRVFEMLALAGLFGAIIVFY